MAKGSILISIFRPTDEMSVIIERLMSRETITLEVYSGYDDQGMQSFATGVSIEAGVIRADSYIIDPSGSWIATPLTLYVPPGQAATPGEQDRITLSGGDVFSVALVTAPRRIGALRSGSPDHTRCRCTRGG